MFELLKQIKQKTFADWRVEMHAKYGPAFQIFSWLGKPFLIYLADPDLTEHLLIDNYTNRLPSFYHGLSPLLGHGLLTEMSYRDWKTQRRTILPAFSPTNIRNQIPILQKKLRVLLDKLAQKAETSEYVDIDTWFVRLTLDFIGESAFNVEFNSLEEEKDNEVIHLIGYSLDFLLQAIRIPILMLPIFPSSIKCRKYIKRLHAIIQNIINEYRKRPQSALTSGNKTLFELLITAKDPETGRELSDEVIRDNVITFLFAGHDTTAHSMAFTVYELTQNPIVLKKLQEELDRVLGDNDMPDANQLKEFEYLDMIIKESLRKHPSAGGTGRTLDEDVDIKGYKFKKGSPLIYSSYSVHRNPQFYPNPEAFDPERFTKEERENRRPSLYTPFSKGQRDCIGKSLSMMEQYVVLASIYKQFEFKLKPNYVLEKRVSITVGPVDGLPVMAVKRNK